MEVLSEKERLRHLLQATEGTGVGAKIWFLSFLSKVLKTCAIHFIPTWLSIMDPQEKPTKTYIYIGFIYIYVIFFFFFYRMMSIFCCSTSIAATLMQVSVLQWWEYAVFVRQQLSVSHNEISTQMIIQQFCVRVIWWWQNFQNQRYGDN